MNINNNIELEIRGRAFIKNHFVWLWNRKMCSRNRVNNTIYRQSTTILYDYNSNWDYGGWNGRKFNKEVVMDIGRCYLDSIIEVAMELERCYLDRIIPITQHLGTNTMRYLWPNLWRYNRRGSIAMVYHTPN
jgi:hypothetical protein